MGSLNREFAFSKRMLLCERVKETDRCSVAHDSHPVGTTVKVMGFLEHIPVRKQMAIKDAAKCLGKIRRVMQAYALARPSARFRLRVLKAKNGNGDFSYAPKAHATVGDAVLKIFGRDCAAQCSFTTVEADGFEIRAFLPKPTAVGSKISGHCSFVAVDARPVSSNRGTIKQMVHACKQRLGKANPSLAGVRDPFFCINIICPPGSYDPNIEPTKDDVMFEDSNIVLRVWEELLDSLYTEAVVNLDEPDDVVDQNPNEAIFESHNTSDQNEASVPAPQPRWRHSMYGIDEEDLEFLQDDRTPIIDEEEGRHAAEVSNPWTITRMNAAIKPRAPANNVQLLSPVKSTGNVDSSSSPSRVPATPNRVVSAEPLTPQTSSKANTVQSLLDDELERSIQRLPPPSSVAGSISDWVLDRLGGQAIDGTGTHVAGGEVPSSVLRSETQAPEPRTSQLIQYRNIATGTVSPGEGPLNQNQPAVRRTTRQKKTKDATTAYRPPGNSQKRLAGVSVQEEATRFFTDKNMDIRNFLGPRSDMQVIHLAQKQSFTPINTPTQSHPRSNISPPINTKAPSFSQNKQSMPHVSPVSHLPTNQSTTSRTEPHTSPPHNSPPTQPPVFRRTSTNSMTSFFRTQEEKAANHSSQHLKRSTRVPTALPHEKTPHSACNLALRLSTDIASIMSFARMYQETVLNWDSVAEFAYGGFNKEMAGGRVVEWVGRIDGKLCGMYERARGADEIRVVMEEGMRKALEGIEWEDEEEQGEEEMLMDM